MQKNSAAANRVLGSYDATKGSSDPNPGDGSGHGTHAASVGIGSGKTPDNYFQAVAPDAHLIGVKGYDSTGLGTYTAVIEGNNWVVANRSAYNVRVMKPLAHRPSPATGMTRSIRR